MNENLEQNQRKRLIRNEWTVLWSHTQMGENSFLPAGYAKTKTGFYKTNKTKTPQEQINFFFLMGNTSNHKNVTVAHTWGRAGRNALFSVFTSAQGWVPKNWSFWVVLLEKTLESPLDCKEIKPVNSKGNQPWIFFERADTEVEAPILWPPDVKSWLIWKHPDSAKDWRQEEKGNDRGWDGWMASPTQWMWVWANSGR